MKPASFHYERPERLDQLVELLEHYGDEAKIIAGGQSLVPMMNMRLARPETLIDINRIKDLDYIRVNDSRLEIGALARQMSLEHSDLLKLHCPILPHAVSRIGHYAIRQRGTVGGSIAHADPSAELPVMAVLLDAQLHIVSADGERVVPANQFFVTIYTTDLMPNECIKAVTFPMLADEGWSYRDFTRRAGDFAIVSVGCLLQLDGDGRVTRLRLAVGGVDDIPRLMQDETDACMGRLLDEVLVQELTGSIIDHLEPGSDLHASADFRCDLLRKLVPETVWEASGRIGYGRKSE